MGSQGGQQNTDATANFFWLLILIAVVFTGVWFFRRQWLVAPIFFLRKLELLSLYYILKPVGFIFHKLNLSILTSDDVNSYYQMILSYNPHKISWVKFSAINDKVSDWVSIPIAFIVFSLGAILFFRNRDVYFKTVYSMSTFRKIESEHWPQIAPVVSLDLVKADPNKGPWAMSQTPMLFCREYDLVFPKVVEGYSVWGLRRGPAFRVFSLQLGRLYTCVASLPIYIKALLVIFIARAERDRDIASKYIRQISASSSSGNLDFTGVEAQMKKYESSKTISWAARRHAYVYTFMATMLEISRSDGVLASSEFLWLKPVDRRLWYMLNHVGRQTSVVEVSGPVSHWMSEKALKKAVKTPMVKQAVDALEEALSEILRKDEGEEWHSRGV